MRFLVPLLLAGCLEPEPVIQGELLASPKYGIVYYGIEADGAGIDGAASWWVNWGLPPEIVTRCTVYVLAGETVDGTHAAWWYGDGRISVARDAPRQSDRHMALDHEGLSWLRHEFFHELSQKATHEGFWFQ